MGWIHSPVLVFPVNGVGDYNFAKCQGISYAINSPANSTSSPFLVIAGLPYLQSPEACELFECSLEAMRRRYGFFVTAYVVMPEHVHLLVSEPRRVLLSKAIQALKLSVSTQSQPRPFWQPRYYDFNVFSEKKCLEKRRYIHRNPVTRGLVDRPIDWHWSSFRHWWTGERGTVEIESRWTAMFREAALNPMSQQQGHGAPSVVENEM